MVLYTSEGYKWIKKKGTKEYLASFRDILTSGTDSARDSEHWRGNSGVRFDDFNEIRAIFLSTLFLNPRLSI